MGTNLNPSFGTEDTFTPDNLFGGDTPIVSEDVTVISGENRTRGALLGKLTKDTVGSPTADGGNTGDGTVTAVTLAAKAEIGTYALECVGLDAGLTAGAAVADGGNTGDGTAGAVTIGAAVEAGTYTLECTAAATNAGTFKVITPSGDRLDDLEVGVAYTSGHINLTISDGATDFVVGDKFTIAVADGGLFKVVAPSGARLGDAVVGTAYTSAQINFTINDGATDFAVGDKFTIAVSGSGKYKLSAAAAVDGSQEPVAVLAQDTDASAGDKTAPVYKAGTFNERAITFGTGHTADSVRDDLAARGIYLKSTVKA